jgi:hypothetical protein
MLDPGGLPNPTTLWMDSGYSFFPDPTYQFNLPYQPSSLSPLPLFVMQV